MLLEMCCVCGFVHKDDRKSYRAYKPHYHWIPAEGELSYEDLTLHATICVACCGLDWKEFFEQKKLTPAKYYVKGSWNAPLPARFLAWATELYSLQAKYFVLEK
jgi:hypothetical protein